MHIHLALSLLYPLLLYGLDTCVAIKPLPYNLKLISAICGIGFGLRDLHP